MKQHEVLLQEILQFDWSVNPCSATAKGIHDYDHLLPPVKLEERQRNLRHANEILAKVNAQLALDIPLEQEIDLRIGKQALIRFLCDEELLTPWQNSPAFYVSQLAQGINTLMSPPLDAQKKDSLLSRLQAAPEFLEHAQRALVPEAIPPIWIQPALNSVKGLMRLLEETLVSILKEENCQEKFDPALTALMKSLEAYATYIAHCGEMAQGDFAVGKAYFDTMLQDYYMVPMNTAQLLQFGQEKVAFYEEQLHNLAYKLNPNQTWLQQLEALRDDHPTPETLIQAYENEKEAVKRFVVEKDLVSIPEGENCVMAETPWYARSTTPMGSMNTSRAYTPGLTSIFNITPINSQVPAASQEQHLRENNYSFIRSIAFHEVIPGHHLQACMHKLQTNEFRKNFYNTVLIEGWGLYTEDLMVEEGYLQGVLHLMQLKNALWRAVRVVVDVGLHSKTLSFEEAVRMLEEKVGQQHHLAYGEVLRYTQGPTYPSSYMLGREQLLQLRQDCEQAWGSEYSKKRFHNELLQYGSMPVALIRRLMLENK